MRKPTPITPSTPTTRADYIGGGFFWLLVLGWPLFVAVWRWLN